MGRNQLNKVQKNVPKVYDPKFWRRTWIRLKIPALIFAIFFINFLEWLHCQY
jgi:hypothetical protein